MSVSNKCCAFTYSSDAGFHLHFWCLKVIFKNSFFSGSIIIKYSCFQYSLQWLPFRSDKHWVCEQRRSGELWLNGRLCKNEEIKRERLKSNQRCDYISFVKQSNRVECFTTIQIQSESNFSCSTESELLKGNVSIRLF